MTLGGMILGCTTILLAAVDGGLSALTFAAAVGGTAYVLTRRDMNKPAERLVATQAQLMRTAVEYRIAHATGEDEVKRIKREQEAKHVKLELQANKSRFLSKEVAAVAGVAAFACPVLGLAAIATLTSDKWAPVVHSWSSEKPVHAPPQSLRMAFTQGLS